MQAWVEATGAGDSVARMFDGMFSDVAEVWQPFPTFGRKCEAGMAVLSRLGRAYSNTEEVQVGRRYGVVATPGLPHVEARPRDHFPLLARITLTRARIARLPHLPHELARIGACNGYFAIL